MRRQGGHYGGDSGGGGGHHTYGGTAVQAQRSRKSGYYQEQQTVTEKEERHQRHQNQWRWERDASQSKLPQTAMSPTAPFPEGDGREVPRSYYQSQRIDPPMLLEKHGSGVPRSQPHEQDMDIGYEDDSVKQTFEGLEQRFLDDIMRLSKEQTEAEDAENARHRERIKAMNAQYEEKLAALRAQHASRSQEFLKKESQARKQQYQQVAMEQYPNDPQGYNAGTAPAVEPHRAYSSDYYDTYREQSRAPGNARDHGYEPKVQYPRGRSYGTGSRYY